MFIGRETELKLCVMETKAYLQYYKIFGTASFARAMS